MREKKSLVAFQYFFPRSIYVKRAVENMRQLLGRIKLGRSNINHIYGENFFRSRNIKEEEHDDMKKVLFPSQRGQAGQLS